MATLFTSPPETIRFVDSDYTGAFSNGSQFAPYTTIQAAIDDFEAQSLSSTPTVRIADGEYPENLVLRSSMNLVSATANQYAVRVIPAAGVSLTVTNATLASLATYRSSGDYADLVNMGSAGPEDVTLSGLYLKALDLTSNGLECLGVKGDVDADTTGFLAGIGPNYTAFGVDNCYVWSDAYFRNCGWLYFRNSQVFDVVNYNTSSIAFYFCYVNDVTSNYNASSPYGEPAYGHTGWVFNRSMVDDVVFSGTETTNNVGDKTQKSCSFGSITLQDTAIMWVRSGHITDGITIAGGATFLTWDTNVIGNLSLAAGAGSVAFVGGYYTGSLTDPGSRLSHTGGNYGD